jgi:stress response protein YsnF
MGNQRTGRGQRHVLPIVAERLQVNRRRVTVGRVRVTKKTRHRDVVVDEPVVREDVLVRRVAVGRFVDGPVPERYVNGRLIVSVLEEVPVVVRRLRVVEELHIERRRQTVKRSQRVTLRREEPIIEREQPPGASLPEPETREDRRLSRRHGGNNA